MKAKSANMHLRLNGVTVYRGPRPKTAYTLLKVVRETVLAEPKRLDMDNWLRRDVTGYDYPTVPECKTVGCIAGWCSLIAPLPKGLQGAISVDAATTLGATNSELNILYLDDAGRFGELFYPELWPVDLRAQLRQTKQGTPEYAAVVAKRIDRFIVEHKAKLQRKRL